MFRRALELAELVSSCLCLATSSPPDNPQEGPQKSRGLLNDRVRLAMGICSEGHAIGVGERDNQGQKA